MALPRLWLLQSSHTVLLLSYQGSAAPALLFTAPAVPVVGWGRLPCSPQGDHHHPRPLCELRSSLAFSRTTPGLGLDVSYQLEEVRFEKL